MPNQTSQFPPEFVSVLQSDIEDTILSVLKAMNVPDQFLDLVRNLRLMGTYLGECEKNSTLAANFGIEDIVIQSIRMVAEYGGVFHGSEGATIPRESVFSASQNANMYQWVVSTETISKQTVAAHQSRPAAAE